LADSPPAMGGLTASLGSILGTPTEGC
jgi:hypothetical protein